MQPIPYSAGPPRTSNTWVNPNSKSTGSVHNQPSAMLTNLASHGTAPAGSTWIPDSGASFHVIGDSQNI